MEFFNMLNALNKTKNSVTICANTHDCVNRLTVNQEITRKIAERYNIQSMNVRRKAEKKETKDASQEEQLVCLEYPQYADQREQRGRNEEILDREQRPIGSEDACSKVTKKISNRSRASNKVESCETSPEQSRCLLKIKKRTR